MAKIHYTSENMLAAMYMQQMMLQAQLIEAQQKIIALQEELDDRKPETPSDDEVFWHIHSGTYSTDAATSQKLTLVQQFLDWNVALAENHLKPYVNPKVYSEVLNQMTRGLPEHLANLKTRAEIKHRRPVEKLTDQEKDDTEERVIQLPLLHNA